MTALWAAVALLICWSTVVTTAFLRQHRDLNAVTEVLELMAAEVVRQDDILVEHDKALTQLGDERLIGGGS